MRGEPFDCSAFRNACSLCWMAYCAPWHMDCMLPLVEPVLCGSMTCTSHCSSWRMHLQA